MVCCGATIVSVNYGDTFGMSLVPPHRPSVTWRCMTMAAVSVWLWGVAGGARVCACVCVASLNSLSRSRDQTYNTVESDSVSSRYRVYATDRMDRNGHRSGHGGRGRTVWYTGAKSLVGDRSVTKP